LDLSSFFSFQNKKRPIKGRIIRGTTFFTHQVSLKTLTQLTFISNYSR